MESVQSSSQTLEKPLIPDVITVDNPTKVDISNRYKKSLEIAKATEKLVRGETLELTELETLQAAARETVEKKWGFLVTNLREGDKVITLSTPKAPPADLRNLNAVLGPAVADKIIKKRKDLMFDFFSSNGFEVLDQDFKISVVKADASWKDEKGLEVQLNSVCKQVDKIMTDFIKTEAAIKSNGSSIQEDKDKIDELLEKLTPTPKNDQSQEEKSGFRMSFGVATVGIPNLENENDFSHIETALIQSFQMAQLAREGTDIEEYGLTYLKAMIDDEIELLAKMQTELEDVVITDFEKSEYPIFEQGKVNKEGKRVRNLNVDLLRRIRNGNFIPLDGEVNYIKLVSMVKKLNLFDRIKQYTHGQIIGKTQAEADITLYEKLKTQVSAVNAFDQYINKAEQSDVSLKDISPTLIEILTHDWKDDRFSSRSEFIKEALKMSDCTYISIDVMDVGVEQIAWYSRLLNVIKEKPETVRGIDIKNLMFSVSTDKTTLGLDKIREIINRIYKEKYGREKLLMSIGGDEIILAVSSEEATDDFLLEIRNAINARVIGIAVTKEEREVESDGIDSPSLIEAHAIAQLKAEEGISLAKKHEEVISPDIRYIREAIRKLSDSDKLTIVEKQDLLKRLNQIGNFVLIEENGTFAIKRGVNLQGYEERAVRVPVEKIEDELAKMRNELKAMFFGLIQAA